MNVALLGYGTVGKGVYELLKRDYKDIIVKYVFLRHPSKANDVDAVVTSNILDILEDQTVDVVIELIGGKTDAYTYIKKALQEKKHVVTANKAVISEHFQELTECAKSNGVRLLYEASVGGGIIILDPLKTISYTNPVYKIEGIINGSTNYILSKIFLENYKLEDALKEANDLGYIETGTQDDMDGLDLCRKINILSMICFHQYFKEEDIIRIPLSNMTEASYAYIKSKDCIVKYIATSQVEDEYIQIHLEPVIISKDSQYAQIHYEENIIQLYDSDGAVQTFKGIGAGRYPTANAVIYDLKLLQEDQTLGIVYDNHYTINNAMKKVVFLAQKGTEFIKTKPKTLEELLQDSTISLIARIDESILSKF